MSNKVDQEAVAAVDDLVRAYQKALENIDELNERIGELENEVDLLKRERDDAIERAEAAEAEAEGAS